MVDKTEKRQTINDLQNGKKDKQLTIYKTLYRKLMNEQHEPH
jgi:hypothetical protein